MCEMPPKVETKGLDEHRNPLHVVCTTSLLRTLFTHGGVANNICMVGLLKTMYREAFFPPAFTYLVVVLLRM